MRATVLVQFLDRPTLRLTVESICISIEVGAFPSDTILHLKERVRDKTGVPPYTQVLSYRSARLFDCYTLQDYGIQDGDKLYLHLRVRGDSTFVRENVSLLQYYFTIRGR
ncbi:hypothetical protein MRX96_036679 [Rhipicephalus microplus]